MAKSRKEKRTKLFRSLIFYILLITGVILLFVFQSINYSLDFVKDKFMALKIIIKELWQNNYKSIILIIITSLCFLFVLILIICRLINKIRKVKHEEQIRLEKEIDSFWEQQDLSVSQAKDLFISEALKAHERQLQSAREQVEQEFRQGYKENMDGYQYEEYCANLFKYYGWDAKTTKKSGDYGVDVIAKKNGIKIVVQCKKWTGSVGLSAVQEIYMAKTMYNANYAMVVTNSSFSTAAKNGSKKTGVLLIKHYELEGCLKGLLKYEKTN